MGDSKKYFWLKLKRDFFKRHDIRIVEDMPNGKDYVLFYLKLLCESVDHEGMLRFSDQIPYNEQMLATITNTNVDIVRMATKVFTELGMMELLDDGTLFMLETQKMVGSETEWAKKKREYRDKKALEDKERTKKDNVRQEIEKEIDTDKEKDIEKEHIKTVPAKKKYGEFQKVTLTDEEYTKLINEYGEETAHKAIEFLDSYIAEKGYKSKSNYSAIRRWVIDAVSKRQSRNTTDWSQIK